MAREPIKIVIPPAAELEAAYRAAQHQIEQLTSANATYKAQRDELGATVAKLKADHEAVTVAAKDAADAAVVQAIADETTAWEAGRAKVWEKLTAVQTDVAGMTGSAGAKDAKEAAELRKLDKAIADATKRRDELKAK